MSPLAPVRRLLAALLPRADREPDAAPEPELYVCPNCALLVDGPCRHRNCPVPPHRAPSPMPWGGSGP